ncbi:MAG TPA: hypothetical protein VMU36_03880 [Spirochaetia bacterium]|nr:hypothetical protein [Spirochaetia bacterium]
MLTRRFLPLVLLVVPAFLPAQVLRIASYNVDGLGEQRKDYVTLAKVITNFDVVAAEDVMSAGGLEKVLTLLADGWEAAISEKDARSARSREFFGFFYNDRVELYKLLGGYPGEGLFSRPPFGANFKVKGSPFSFNLVACHIDSESGAQSRSGQIDRLGDVYRYFEKMTGNRGITIMAGDFGEERIPNFRSLTALGGQEVLPRKATTMGKSGPDREYDHIFVSPALRPRVAKADVLYWTRDFEGTRSTVSTHFPVYLVLKAGR